jgi:hypothetical protein
VIDDPQDLTPLCSHYARHCGLEFDLLKFSQPSLKWYLSSIGQPPKPVELSKDDADDDIARMEIKVDQSEHVRIWVSEPKICDEIA